MKFKSNEEIRQAIQGVADEMDIEIIEVAAKISKNPSLTVFIDTENGVDLDICEKFHNAIDPVLDELDPSFGAAYTLNVSSPGLDRPLKTERDFKKCIGKEVEIKLATPITTKSFSSQSRISKGKRASKRNCLSKRSKTRSYRLIKSIRATRATFL